MLLSAALPAAAALAGLRSGRPWTVWVLIVVTLLQGLVAGALLPRFWRVGRPAAAERDRWLRRLGGAGGRYLLFLGAVAFGAVEAHAVGAGIARGAPRAALLLLVPPVAVAVWALRDAVAGLEPAGAGTPEGEAA